MSDEKIEQALTALESARYIRRSRAELKQQRDPLAVASVIEDPPAWAETWDLLDALKVVPGLGRVRITRMMESAEVENRPLSKLPLIERSMIAQMIRSRYEMEEAADGCD